MSQPKQESFTFSEKGLPMKNTLAYLTLTNEGQAKVSLINTPFSSWLTNGPNKLECYITQG